MEREHLPPAEGYYFGCLDDVGHFLRRPDTWRSIYPNPAEIPWEHLDGALTPKVKDQGAAALHHKDGWTALACHDYTVDSRGGSNSVFLMRGMLSFDAAIAEATRLFPDVVKRIGTMTWIES